MARLPCRPRLLLAEQLYRVQQAALLVQAADAEPGLAAVPLGRLTVDDQQAVAGVADPGPGHVLIGRGGDLGGRVVLVDIGGDRRRRGVDVALVAVGRREAVQALPGAAGRDVGGPVRGVPAAPDRSGAYRGAAADGVGPLVDVVVPVDHQVDLVAVERGHEVLLDATVTAVGRAGAVRAVVE